eukprot:c5776_g1_i1.p1 GENE.c5776_g1_i1~~c5776_g1_i1.p1  ORF type:complete len:467 (+),score=75.93 c5776_g1_i1:2-1402(+)
MLAIVAALAQPAYMTHMTFGRAPNYLWDCITAESNALAAPLIMSLLNTCGAYPQSRWAVPFAGHVYTSSHYKAMTAALQTVHVLLQTFGKSARPNGFVSALAAADAPAGRQALFVGVNALIRGALTGSLAVPAMDIEREAVMLLWRLAESGPSLRASLVASDCMPAIIEALLAVICKRRTDTPMSFILQLAVFVLLRLSAEPDFGARLHEPYVATLPLDAPFFSGSLADAVINVAHRAVTTGTAALIAIHECLVSVLANTAPHGGQITVESALRLVDLLARFGASRRVRSPESSTRTTLELLVRTLNTHLVLSGVAVEYALASGRERLIDLVFADGGSSDSAGGDDAPDAGVDAVGLAAEPVEQSQQQQLAEAEEARAEEGKGKRKRRRRRRATPSSSSSSSDSSDSTAPAATAAAAGKEEPTPSAPERHDSLGPVPFVAWLQTLPLEPMRAAIRRGRRFDIVWRP